MHLLSLEYKRGKNIDRYPFNTEMASKLDRIEFNRPVTIFVGENGSGKSTLLESMAAHIGSITVGGESVAYDKRLQGARDFSRYLRLAWSKRTKKGFFLRAEDFISYTKRIEDMKMDLRENIDRIDEEYEGRSDYSKKLAKGPSASSLSALEERYGDGLETRSHGESFLELFKTRFVPNGLYLLDEPETPLSPMNQLSFISLVNQMVELNGQFIIATHSPILMAIPNAEIISFDGETLEKVDYDDLEHVIIMRSFLNNKESYLKHL